MALYEHDCSICRFMGTVHSHGQYRDFYVCVGRDEAPTHLVVRNSDESSDYSSFPADVCRTLIESGKESPLCDAYSIWEALVKGQTRFAVEPVTVKITKLFHKSMLAVQRGMSFEEEMRFSSFEAACDWAREVNSRFLINDYHVTSVYVDGGTWSMLAISDIWDWATNQPGDWMADYWKYNPRA